MIIVATFDPSMTTSDTFTVPQSNGKMVVWNESNISLMFSFQNGHTAYVPAWTGVLFCGPWGNVNVTWQHQAVLASANPPLSQVVVEVYQTDEFISGTFPMPLTRQTNVGNNIPVGAATNIVNDGNVAGTQIVEATVAGDPTSAVSILNNGHMSLGTVNNSAVVTFVGSSGNFTFKATGEVDIDLKLLCNLIIAELGNDLALDVATGHKIALQNNGSDIVDVTGSGLSFVSGGIQFVSGALSRIQFGVASGVTSAGQSVTHNLGVAPDVVFCTLDNVGVGEVAQAANLGATTFTISTSGATGRTVWWLALKA